jgi:hypothetical protein
MKKLLPLYIAFLVVSVMMYSCREDFELNAPYKDSTVVFGLIDQGVDTQFIKINKSFLGEGNNTAYAHINDCTIYQNIVARVDEIKNGVVQNSYPLSEIYVKNLEPGIFYTDSQKVYYFVPQTSIDQDATYRLVASVNEGSKEVSAETKVVKEVIFNQTFVTLLSSGVRFKNATTGNYTNIEIKWKSTQNGKRYTPFVRFYYTEHTSSGVEEKVINWQLATQESFNVSGNQDMSSVVTGGSFYGMIASRVPNDPSVIKRVIGRFEFFVSVADEDLNTYIKLNAPAQGVVTERPVYTNVNNGIGIFGSRYTAGLLGIPTGPGSFKQIKLDKPSVEELCEGQYTNQLRFCTDSLAWQFESYFCN